MLLSILLEKYPELKAHQNGIGAFLVLGHYWQWLHRCSRIHQTRLVAEAILTCSLRFRIRSCPYPRQLVIQGYIAQFVLLFTSCSGE